MKISELRKLVREVLDEVNEANVVGSAGTGASFTPGFGAQYATPKAFSKGKGKNVATKTAEKFGMKVISRPKHPSHTKMFDYLQEKLGFQTPNAFSSEEEMYNGDPVKKSEELGFELENKPKNPSKKKPEVVFDKKESVVKKTESMGFKLAKK